MHGADEGDHRSRLGHRLCVPQPERRRQLLHPAILLDQGQLPRKEAPRRDHSLHGSRAGHGGDTQCKDVFVSRLVTRDRNGPRTTFQAGDDVWLDVDVTANKRCERLSFAVFLRNRQNIEVFNTSTLRLGLPSLTLEAGETRTFTVHLSFTWRADHFISVTYIGVSSQLPGTWAVRLSSPRPTMNSIRWVH